MRLHHQMMPQITAIAAKIRNRIVSISGNRGYQQPGDEQIDQRDGNMKVQAKRIS